MDLIDTPLRSLLSRKKYYERKTATKRSRATGPAQGEYGPRKKVQCLLDKVLVGEVMLDPIGKGA